MFYFIHLWCLALIFPATALFLNGKKLKALSYSLLKRFKIINILASSEQVLIMSKSALLCSWHGQSLKGRLVFLHETTKTLIYTFDLSPYARVCVWDTL